mmetsp:Transcript_939/g.1001  ORF Transcript_939/g.1001 Transcript_939/m.1001 type:complete len:250 (+) Transcript_939:91-840(+)
MHDLLPGCVDEGPTLGHLREQRLVDGLLGLVCKRHVQRHVLVIEELCHCVDRSRAHLCNLVLGDIWIIGIHLHAKGHCQLPDSSGHGTKAIEGYGAVDKFKAAGTVIVVPGTRQHHTEDELCNGIGVLAWRVHCHHALLLAGRKVDVVIPSARTDADLQLCRLVKHCSIHDVAADDHGIHRSNCCEELILAFVVLQLLQRVLGIFEDVLDLGDCVLRESLLCGKEHGPGLSCLSCHWFQVSPLGVARLP